MLQYNQLRTFYSTTAGGIGTVRQEKVKVETIAENLTR